MSTFIINNKKIAHNTIALYIRMAFTMLVSFFTTSVALKVLGSQDYGLNNLVGGIVAMFSFINGSMGTAVQRFYSVCIGNGDTSRLKRIFGCGLYVHLIVALLTVSIAEVFAVFFLHKLNIPTDRIFAANIVFQLAIVSMFFNILSVPYAAMLRAREDFIQIAYADIITSILRLAILYFLVVINFDKLIVYASLNFFISIWYILFLIYKARKYKETHTSICRDKEIIREMISFVSLLIFTVLAQLLRDNGIPVLVNLFFGLTLNAAFAISTQVSHLATTFVMSFKQSVVPQLMASWGAGDKHSMCDLINWGTKVTFTLMLIISIPIIFESEIILKLWLDSPPENAYKLVSLAIISINISSYTYFLYQAVHATGKIKLLQCSMSVMYLLNIFLIYILFEVGFNYYFAYYTSIIFSLVQCVINIYAANKYLGLSIKVFCIDVIYRSIIVILITLICVIPIYICISSGLLRLIFVSLVGLVISILASYYVLLTRTERDRLLGLFLSR